MCWRCRNWEPQEILIELRKIERALEHPRITHFTLQEIFTLSVSYTNTDGTIATGSLTQTIVAAPSPDITSFTIEQTA